MIAKILLTIAVVGGILLLTRHRRGSARRTGPVRRPAPWIQALVYAGVLAVIAGAGIAYYGYWADANQLVTVRVINSDTGDVVTYRARRESIGGRRFKTVDGREVRISSVERIEIIESPAGS